MTAREMYLQAMALAKQELASRRKPAVVNRSRARTAAHLTNTTQAPKTRTLTRREAEALGIGLDRHARRAYGMLT